MRNRTAKFASIIIAGLFTGIILTASLTATPASAADECLTAPKDQAPQGSHWRYHTEHSSNRHCWYLREDEPHAQTARPKPFASAKPVAPKAEAAMPGTVADARAELPLPRAPLDEEKAAGAAQSPAAADAANAADTDNTTRSNPATANMLSSVVASRWPEQLSANSPPPTAPVSAPASAPAEPQADEIPQAQPVSVPLAAADASMTKKSNSALMLLIVIVGALSFAGLVASAIVRFGGKRRGGQRVRRGHRWAWDQESSDRRRSSPFPFDAVRRPNIGLPRELQVAEDTGEGDRITQMMARLARSAQPS